MIRVNPAPARQIGLGLLAAVALATGGSFGHAQETEPSPGQFFTIQEPVDQDVLARIRTATRQVIDRAAAQGKEPVLVFEIRPNPTGGPSTEFGSAYDLANHLSTKLLRAKTVAYVPEPLSGFAVLVALACDEIVMGPDASLGPITPEEYSVDPAVQEPLRFLARRKGREPDLLLGMLDREADLRSVRTADKQLHYVLADNLEEFRKTHTVIEDRPAWEGVSRGVLTARRAREEGFVKLLAEHPADVRNVYNLTGQNDDPTLGEVIKPVWIQIIGPIDVVKSSYIRNKIQHARRDGVNLIFLELNSEGGIDKAADSIADLLSSVKDIKTVAYVSDRALGVSALIPLACDDIVFRQGAEIGDVRQLVTGRNGQVDDLAPAQVVALAGRAEALAADEGHPAAVARAMVDPDSIVVRAKDTRTGAVVFVLQSQIATEPERYVDVEVRKQSGQVLRLSAEEAASYGLGLVVSGDEELKGLYGLANQTIRPEAPSWVDSLVTTLNDPFVSWVLLFVGLFMLILELKLPGIGLPAITSALAFLLFFWSHYLSGTADQLEIMLFLVGMICLALELFVFPGFGVFGMSGILLVLISVVMASHTFVWPTQEYEYRQMGRTLIRLMVVLGAVGGGAVILGKYFPSLPIFNKLVLKPEPWDAGEDPSVKPAGLDGIDSFFFLVGETGRTTTVLKPTGKARFGDLLIDVTADGFFIEADRLIEVVDVQGNKVVVKSVKA